MKTVKLTERYLYVPPGKEGRVSIDYKTPGKTYKKVPEAHAEAIVQASCGEIVEAKPVAADEKEVKPHGERKAEKPGKV